PAIEPIGDRYFSLAAIGLLMEPRPIGGRPVTPQEPPLTTVSKTPIAAAAFAPNAPAAFLQIAWEFKPGLAPLYAGPGKMSAMAMASGEKSHDAMMKHATKVPANTVFFMHNNELYSVSGTLDPTGNFYRP